MTQNSFEGLLLVLLGLSLNRDSQVVQCSSSNEEGITLLLNSFYFSHLGGLTSSSVCSHHLHKYVIGMRVRMSNFLNQSVPSVNVIGFICSDEIEEPEDAKGTVVMQSDEGGWSDVIKCPQRGFVTGLSMFMQLLRGVSIPDMDRGEDQVGGRYYDVFQLGRGTYISGLTLNCSYTLDALEPEYEEEPGPHKNTKEIMPPWNNTVSIGTNSGIGVRLYCSGNRILSGMVYEKEALITRKNGEHWVPVDLTIKCSLLPNPVEFCTPELDWDDLGNITCQNITNSEDDSDYVDVTCNVPHLNGLQPNRGIENLDQILNAYKTLKLQGSLTRTALMAILHGYYNPDWSRTFQLDIHEYKRIVKNLQYKITHEKYRANFSQVSYEEPEYCSQIRQPENEPLKYEYSVKQLVGYCSIYKIYYPHFKTQFQVYFERNISGVASRIIFPSVDPKAKLIDLIQTKLSALNLKKSFKFL